MGITKEQFRDAIAQVKTFILGKTSNMVPKTRTINGKALSEDITLKASDIGADASGTAANQITSHNISTAAHNDIRLLITGLTDRLNALANSDDTTLDQMKEVVAYIKANRELIESITTTKVSVDSIINNLETNVSDQPLSATQGVILKGLIDTLQSQLNSLSTHVENEDVHVTPEQKENWNAAFETKHGHANWSILNSITQTLLDGWNSAVSHITDSVKHVTSEERTKWNNKASTDTKNTAGATNTSAKIFLIGATAQNSNPQTYTHDTVYIGEDGYLYVHGLKVLCEEPPIKLLSSSLSTSSYVTLKTTIPEDNIYTFKIYFTGTPNTAGDMVLTLTISVSSSKASIVSQSWSGAGGFVIDSITLTINNDNTATWKMYVHQSSSSTGIYNQYGLKAIGTNTSVGL